MSSDTIYIYTDASFSKTHAIAIIGSAFFGSTEEHETVSISEKKINILEIQESNNIRAEIKSTIVALESCLSSGRIAQQVTLYTDCQAVCGLPRRRKKLEQSQYMSQSKNRPLANADLYKRFYVLYDQLKLELVWIKGHSSGTLSKIQRNFAYLDKDVRRILRMCVVVNQIEHSFRQTATRDGIIKFCVGVLLEQGSDVLLVRRAKDDFLGGFWELPGGGVEPGETFQQTIERESFEELGIEVTGYGRELKSFDYLSQSGKKTRQFNIVIHAKYTEIKLNPKEHDEFQWANSKNYSTLPLSPEIASVLSDYFQIWI